MKLIPSYVWFKEGYEKELLEEYQQLAPRAQIIAEDMGRFFVNAGYKLVITDIMSEKGEDERLKRVSRAHSEGRAFDFRTRGIPEEFLAKVEKTFEHIYKHWAALSKETKKEQLIVYHDNGNGKHAHVQIRRG
jgi:hypothetical protein